jgi:hypothetical protein
MRKQILVLACVAALGAPAASSADCQRDYQNEIIQRTVKLAKFKKTEKRVLLIATLGTGVPTGAFMGFIFHGLTGASVAGSVALGALSGGLVGGGVAGSILVPMTIVRLVKQSRLKSYVVANSIIDEAARFDHSGVALQALLAEVQGAGHPMDLDDLIGAINEANRRDAFCDGTLTGHPGDSSDKRLAKPQEIRRYLLGLGN